MSSAVYDLGMEGGGLGDMFGDPEELQRRLAEFAEQMQGSQRLAGTSVSRSRPVSTLRQNPARSVEPGTSALAPTTAMGTWRVTSAGAART